MKCARCNGDADFACFRVPGWENGSRAYEPGAPLPDEPSHFLCHDCGDRLEMHPETEAEWHEFGWDEALVVA